MYLFFFSLSVAFLKENESEEQCKSLTACIYSSIFNRLVELLLLSVAFFNRGRNDVTRLPLTSIYRNYPLQVLMSFFFFPSGALDFFKLPYVSSTLLTPLQPLRTATLTRLFFFFVVFFCFFFFFLKVFFFFFFLVYEPH